MIGLIGLALLVASVLAAVWLVRVTWRESVEVGVPIVLERPALDAYEAGRLFAAVHRVPEPVFYPVTDSMEIH